MPSNAVFNIYQDHKGFIWFASNAGLTRYDGFEYKTYSSPAQTSTPGSSIFEDNYGRIWYVNFDGYIYYVEKDSLYAFQQNKPIQYLPLTITDNHLFVFQNKGVDVYDNNTLNIKTTISVPLRKVEFSGSNQSNFYFIESDMLYRLAPSLKLSSSSFFQNRNIELKQIYINGHKIYVVGKYNTSKLIYVFNEALEHLYNIPIEEPKFIQGINFIDSLIWIHSPQGSYTYVDNQLTTGLYQRYFKEKNISCVKKDRQQNYWFSTTNEGVFMVPNLGNVVYTQQNLLLNKIVSAKKGYIIATKKGELCSYDSSLNFKSIINKDIDNSEIYCLSYDSVKNDLFYSSKGFNYLPKIKYGQRKFYQLAVKEVVKLDERFYAFAASGYCGLVTFNDQNLDSSLWTETYLKKIKAEVQNTSSIIEGVRGKSVAYNRNTQTIYFATNIGLFKCTPNSTTEIKFNGQSFYASRIVLYNNIIYALSTKGDLYSIKNEVNFDQLNELNIKKFDVKFIKQYGKNLIVIAGGYAYIFDLETEKLTKIDVNINAYEINDVLLKNNTLLLLTNSGIIKTDVNSSATKKSKPVFQITDLLASGKALNLEESSELPYNQNDIAIRFSVLDFGNSNDNNVFYKVNDDDWKSVSNETRIVDFASLKPGKYAISFRINEEAIAAVIQFSITAPFWQTTWFIIICFLLALAVGFIYYIWQINKLRAKNKLLQEKIELELNLNKSVLKSIKAQMNPHFFYNALNTIQAYIFTNDKTNANNYLAKFSKLTRIILEQSEKETISLADEIESLNLYLALEKMRFHENFEYTIDLVILSHKDSIEFPPMLIQPYVENAIKHGLLHKDGNRQLTILFEERNHHLFITIDDNGVGRKRSQELNRIKNEKYQSFSTQANEKRLEILNRHNDKIAVKIVDKIDDMGKATGTKVILTIPIV